MNVGFTDEQQMLLETVAALAADIGPSNPHDLERAMADDAKAWGLLADSGLLGLHLPEAAGGSGTSGVEVMIVAEQLAARSCAVPFLGCGVLAPELLAAAGANPALIAEVTAGRRRLTVALDRDLQGLARIGTPGALAWDAAGAEAALALDEDGRVVAVAVEGETLTPADLTRSVTRLGAPAVLDLGDLGGPLAAEASARWEAMALTVLAADLVGTMQAALTSAVEYAKERVQFDTRIGTFQALQHLCAEAHVLLEGARSITWHAAWAVDRLAPADALLAARSAKAYAAENAVTVAETSIQVHGGVAITWEYMPHVFLRRALLDRKTLGDEDAQYAAIADHRLAPRTKEHA